MKMYKALLPDFCGYGSVGYGKTVAEAMEACEKGYQDLFDCYAHTDRDEDWGTFRRAWEYFCGDCVVISPGLYSVVRGEPDADLKEVLEFFGDNKKAKRGLITKAKFTIDGGEFVEGYSDPHDTWNGWACPYFTAEQLREIPRVFEWEGSESEIKMIDGVCHVTADGEEWDRITPEEVETDDGKLVLYYFNLAWVWDRYEQE